MKYRNYVVISVKCVNRTLPPTRRITGRWFWRRGFRGNHIWTGTDK